ncbi:reverse transcriptase domain-containing protein, partial [Tanacetum coccineum]
PSISLPPREEVERILALTTPPPSPLTLLSSPLPHIPSPPLSASPLASVLPASPHASPSRPLGYRAHMIRLRAEAASTSHSLPLSPPIILSHTRLVAPSSGTPPLHLLSTDRKEDKPKVCLPPRKRLCSTQGPRYEIGESSSAATARPIGGRRADYVSVLWIPRLDDKEPRRSSMGLEMFGSGQERRIIYVVIGATQDTADPDISETGRSIRSSSYGKVTDYYALSSVVMGQQAVISQLQAADRRSQTVTSEMLQADRMRQAKIVALRTFDRTSDSTTGTTGTLWRSSTASCTGGGRNRVFVGRKKAFARECTYQDFMKCKPLYFKGTKGVVELTQWFKRMETVFRISNCSVDNPDKVSNSSLLTGALTWRNSTLGIVGQDVAIAMTWIDLRKKMTDKYCPRNEMKKLEVEMFPEESDKVERYVGELPDMIQGSVVASKPKTMQEATEMAYELMDKKINTIAERQAKNKRKFENTSRNNQNQQRQENRRRNTGRAYTAGSGDKKSYAGSKPLCPKCNFNHNGTCAPKCYKCNKFGHLGRNCRSSESVNPGSNQRGNETGQGPTCFECGVRGHFKTDCPKLNNNNNNNRGNQVRNANALAKVYAVGYAGINPDSNFMMGTFLLNNRYASILFDTGVDRIFVSTAFSSKIDITPSTLDHYYDVELADGRIIGLNTI